MTFTVRVIVPSLSGDTRSRVFDVEADDFLHAVEAAEGVREDDERLISVVLGKDAPNVPQFICGVDLDALAS